MKGFFKFRHKTAGLPPGTLVYTGNEPPEKAKIRLMDYNQETLIEKDEVSFKECVAKKDENTVTWIDVEGLNDIPLLEDFGKQFDIHPLVLEDILNVNQRPKMEIYDDYVYIVLKMVYSNAAKNEILTEQVSIILSKKFVISFQEGLEGDTFDHVRQMIRASKGRIRKNGTDYLVYALIDSIVDHYFGILEEYGDKIEILEEDLIADPTRTLLNRIHDLKREMLMLRKSVWPMREVLNTFVRGESTLVQDETVPYIRDVYDHTIHIIDTTETFRDMIAGMLDIYLSSISNRINEVMKVLTIITTIFIPLTFIAGIYGMNFDTEKSPWNMPELKWAYGYPAVLILMAFIAIMLIFYFKKKKWL